MHSYIACTDGSYVVGVWLSQSNHPVFRKMFKVGTLRDAVQAVCILQGGTGGSQVTTPNVIEEYRMQYDDILEG